MSGNLTSKKTSSEYCSVLLELLNKTTNPRLGLSRMAELLLLIGFDRSAMRIIQVVGTNGKGSTVAFVESILQKNGISTGLFTSPHLSTARERIRINGQMVSMEDFVKSAQHVLQKAKAMADPASFFECMLAIAMHLFNEKHVAVAILEAGLGGRLDATTATKPDILGVTMIDLDHQEILGKTAEDITREKIGAARRNQLVITVPQIKEAEDALEKAKTSIKFKLLKASRCEIPIGLFGEHQKENAGLAIELVKQLGIPTDPLKTEQGLLLVNWPARFEVLDGECPIVLDGAHNASGILSLADGLKKHPKFANKSLIVVYGSLKGANASKKIELLLNNGLKIERVFLHQPRNPRALILTEQKALFIEHGLSKDRIHEFTNLDEVFAKAKELSACVVVCGSLYTVGEIRSVLLDTEADPKMPDF